MTGNEVGALGSVTALPPPGLRCAGRGAGSNTLFDRGKREGGPDREERERDEEGERERENPERAATAAAEERLQ